MDLSKITVSELKELNFSKLPLERQYEIKQLRPTPFLNLIQITKGKTRDFKRMFKNDIYERYPWICGCESTNRLYCFPCLLFAKLKRDISWVRIGVADLSHLTQKGKKHEWSHSHLNSVLEFNLLGKIDIRQQLDSTFRLSIKKHNEKVAKNRYVLSKVIDCIIFCGAFELALRGHHDYEDSMNSGVFKGLINFSAELDLSLKDQLTSTSIFKGTSKDIQNDLLDCMLAVCQNHIKNEISRASFVSTIVDETTDVSPASQLVIVFRYVLCNGQPVERFWDFKNPLGQDAKSDAECIQATLEKVIDKTEKLISQSYDGVNVVSGNCTGVQAFIQETYKNAHLVHCYAHQLNLVVQQATSQNQEVRVFFSNLSDITNFFSGSPQRKAVLEDILNGTISKGSAAGLNFKSQIISTVYNYREHFIACMKKIESTSKQSSEINKAWSIRHMLNDSIFVFWLTVFHNIMPHVDVLCSQLQKTKTDVALLRELVHDFQISLECEKKRMETEVVVYSESENILSDNVKRDPIHVDRTVEAQEMFDVIVNQIIERFAFISHYSAVSLLEVKKFKKYEKNFPYELVMETTDAYPILQIDRLKTELGVIYKRTDFRNINGTVSLLQFIIENNLHDTFSETYKLLLIVATIPMTTAEEERCFSTLKRIKTFLRSTISEDRLSALAMLSVEKDMIRKIPKFNESVIDLFASKKDHKVDLTYKNCT